MRDLSVREIEEMRSIRDFRSKAPKMNTMLKEAFKYSFVSRGITVAYNWALCAHREELARNAPAKSKRWKDARQIHLKQFEFWRDRLSKTGGWKIDSFRTACRNFDELAGISGEEFDQVAGFVNNCCNDLYSAKPTAVVLSGMADKVKEQERANRGNSSRFEESAIEVPEMISDPSPEPPFELYQFDYRWTQGRSNLLDLKRRG
jgi:hypothetical protein